MAGEKKMGRPVGQNNKTKMVVIRLTEQEHADLMEAVGRANTTISGYVLSNTIRNPNAFCPDAALLRDAYLELRRQGVNLNQISSALNRIASCPSAADAQTAGAIARIAKEVESLVGENSEDIKAATKTILRVLAGTKPRG